MIGALRHFNIYGEVMYATRHSNSLVKKGDIVAATRTTPPYGLKKNRRCGND